MSAGLQSAHHPLSVSPSPSSYSSTQPCTQPWWAFNPHRHMWVRCVLFRTCCGIDSSHHTPSLHRPVPAPSAEPVLSPPPAGPFLYARHDTESPGYYLHYLKNDSGSEKYTCERGENNQPPLTGFIDHWWLQAPFKKGYSALLCL